MNLHEKISSYQPVKNRFYIRKRDNLVVMVKDIVIKDTPEGPTVVFTLGDCFASLLEEKEDNFLHDYRTLH